MLRTIILPLMRPDVIYLLLIVFVLVLLGALGGAAWRHREAPGGRAFVGFAIAAALWCALIGAMALSAPEVARVLLSLKYVAISSTALLTFVFITKRTGRLDGWPRWRWIALAVVPLLGAVASFRDASGMVSDVRFARSMDVTFIETISFGPLYWLFTSVIYGLTLVGLMLILLARREGGVLARTQMTPLSLGLVAPLLTNVALITGIAPRTFDPMPLGLAISALALWWGAFRGRLFDLIPLARRAVVDGMQDGILILDAERRVLDANAPAARLLGGPPASLIGRPLDACLGRAPGLGDGVRAALGSTASVTVMHGAQVFDVRSISVTGDGRRARAEVLVFHEVTERQQLQDEQARLIGQLQAALAQVRTLTGLLPICAACKCIRDETGEWLTLEIYIRDRTDAEFTHGLCPACVDSLYPDVVSPSSD